MRLINCHTLKLEDFFGRPIPPYYILSHRWTDDEISYKDFNKGRRKDSKGYLKVTECCRCLLERHRAELDLATFHGHVQPDEEGEGRSEGTSALRSKALLSEACYVWIDTCCIDKRSSAELSESINSMYDYYANAIRCYAFLSDVDAITTRAVDPSEARKRNMNRQSQFYGSQWFTRGWTLQELLAPVSVVFLDNQWQILGHKCDSPMICGGIQNTHGKLYLGPSLNRRLAEITGIDTQYMLGARSTGSASIACRMSWASQRTTLRTEDTAYCLLGLLGVNMPLLYGEGERAFFRLQEELTKRSNDQSIFAWSLEGEAPNNHFDGFESRVRPLEEPKVSGLFARSPKDFASSRHVKYLNAGTWPYMITNTGLELRTMARHAFWRRQLDEPGHHFRQDILIVSLNCFHQGFERQRYKIYGAEAADSREYVAAQIALIEVPKQLPNNESLCYPTPVKLYQRIHGLERTVAAGDIADTEEDTRIYVKTFDEVNNVPEPPTYSWLHLERLFGDDTGLFEDVVVPFGDCTDLSRDDR